MTEYPYKGDRTTRLEHLENPITAVTSEPNPEPTSEAESVYEALNARIEAVRTGNIERHEPGGVA